MAGFSKGICQCITLWISVILVLNCIAIVTAQTDTDIRVEWAAQYADGTVIVHVSTPRGTEVLAAQLRTDDANLNLSASPFSSEIIHWLVLDASEDMVNTGAAVQNSLTNLVRSFGGETFGVIIYDDLVSEPQISSTLSEIEAALDTYDPQDNPIGCVYDALAKLAEMQHIATEAWRILVISSSMTSQVHCHNPRFEDFGVPVDVLAIGTQDTTALRSLAAETGGEFRSSTIYQIQSSWNAIDSQWSRPIYRLSSRAGANVNREGDLFLQLSDGSQATVNIELVHIDDLLPNGSKYIPPTPIPPTHTPVPTETALPTFTATHTEVIPTTTLTPSNAAVIAVVSTQDEPSPSPAKPTNSPQPVATQPVITPQGETQAQISISDSNTTLVNNLIIIIGGVAVGLVIVFVIYTIVQNSAAEIEAHHQLAQSGIEISSNTPMPPLQENFYDVHTDHPPVPQPKVEVQAAQPDTDKLDNTEMENPGGDGDGTQVWSIEDLQEAIRMPTVATLMGSVDDTLYDISGPRTLLGSGTMCQIKLSGATAIAEEHLLFDIDDDNKVTATLLTNQTVYINGKRLLHTRQLQSGDEIQLSPDVKMIFNYLED